MIRVRRLFTTISIVVTMITILTLNGCNAEPQYPPEQMQEQVSPLGEKLHEEYNKFLARHVKDGFVDYAELKNDEGMLDKYLQSINNTNPEALETENEQLAYWINAYNAFTLKLILNYYPDIKSIKDISDFPIPKRWKARIYAAGGKRYSLNEIEHEILRKRFKEPRVHFAIVCASKSCPDLTGEAYMPDKIDEQLSNAAKRFLSDTSKGLKINHDNVVYLSQILSWFEEDFVNAEGSIIRFVKKYAAPEITGKLSEDMKIRYMDYDWSLNGK